MKKIFILLPIILIVILVSLAGCSKTTKTTKTTDDKSSTQTSEKDTSTSKENTMTEAPKMQIDSNKTYMATLKTSMGDIEVKLYAKESPKTVNNFVFLSKKGFYNGTIFHRVIKEFMIQGGDPNGTDGPGYQFEDEINDHKLVQGSLAMANSGPNTNGSQFFIVTAKTTDWLDGKHTNFGEVTKGMDVVLKLGNVETGQGDVPVNEVKIEKVTISEK